MTCLTSSRAVFSTKRSNSRPCFETSNPYPSAKTSALAVRSYHPTIQCVRHSKMISYNSNMFQSLPNTLPQTATTASIPSFSQLPKTFKTVINGPKELGLLQEYPIYFMSIPPMELLCIHHTHIGHTHITRTELTPPASSMIYHSTSKLARVVQAQHPSRRDEACRSS